MRHDDDFKALVKDWKRNRDVLVQFQDQSTTVDTWEEDGTRNKAHQVTGATVYQGELLEGNVKDDGKSLYVWNINNIELPKSVPWMGGEPVMVSKEEQDLNDRQAMYNNRIDYNYHHRYKDDPINSQIGLYLSAHKNATVTIQVGMNNTSYDYVAGETNGEFTSNLSGTQLARQRAKEIEKGLRSVPYMDRSRVKIEIVKDPKEQTKIIKN